MFNNVKNNIDIIRNFQIGLFEVEGMKVRGVFHKNDRLLMTKLLTTYIPKEVDVKLIEKRFFIGNDILKTMVVDYIKYKDISNFLAPRDYEEARNSGFNILSNLYI